LKELGHHFEGIRGELHRTEVSYLFENITISLILVRRTAKVAGFWGPEEVDASWVVLRVLLTLQGASRISEYER
jgi:hypothetical protein